VTRIPRLALAVAAPLGVAALACAALGAAQVQSTSMSPTLASGAVVVYDRILPPARGDIVLFAPPDGWDAEGATLVKRVIGVAGDAVRCCEAGTGRLLVNDAPIDEPYVAGERPGGTTRFEITVPDGAVWVMGDNRAESYDSRETLDSAAHGLLAAEQLRGVVRLRF
jgi:signal peptidase I